MSTNNKPGHDRQASSGLTRMPALRPSMLAAVALVVPGAVLVLLWPRTGQLPDFSAYENVGEMKRAFFSHIAPAVAAENRRVLQQRSRLLGIAEDFAQTGEIGWLDRRWIRRLAADYAVAWDGDDPAPSFEMLRQRVDIVPVPLALVQAATESGWGRSRFAVEGNNLFGQWCYTPGCGLVPADRRAGANHEVATFDSVDEAVAGYVHNLNTHAAYQSLRRVRQQQRDAGYAPRADVLIDGLGHYSERGDAYVEEIRSMLHANRSIIEEVIGAE